MRGRVRVRVRVRGEASDVVHVHLQERGAGGVVPRFHDTTHFLAQMYVESILSLTPNPHP